MVKEGMNDLVPSTWFHYLSWKEKPGKCHPDEPKEFVSHIAVCEGDILTTGAGKCLVICQHSSEGFDKVSLSLGGEIDERSKHDLRSAWIDDEIETLFLQIQSHNEFVNDLDLIPRFIVFQKFTVDVLRRNQLDLMQFDERTKGSIEIIL